MLAAACRVCRRTLLQGLARCPWRCTQACGLSSVPGGPLLVVHPRDKPSAHLQVRRSAAATLAGNRDHTQYATTPHL
jgi:hypothetical protein